MKKSVITLLIFLIMIISVSAVSAADDALALGASDDATVSVANTDTAVAADKDVKNFTELNSDIADAYAPETLTLSSDYVRNTTEDFSIAINDDLVIDGNGSRINGSNMDIALFQINSGNVVLKNMILDGIKTNGIVQGAGSTLTLDNVTFIFYGAQPLGYLPFGVNSAGTLTVTNCVYTNLVYGIALNNGATFLSPSIVNVTAETDANWYKIYYEARVFDDNGNRIYIDDSVTWTVGINDELITNTGNGFIFDTVNAKRYGQQVINATNTVLTNPTINTATVTVTPDEQDSIITFTYVPAEPVWNDEVNITVTITKYPGAGPLGELAPTGKVNITFTAIDKTETIDLVNGSANYTINNIDLTSYNTVFIQYGGDDVFKANYTTESITVKQKVPVINITVNNDTVGQPVITVTLPSDVVGVVNATIYLGTTEILVLPSEQLTSGVATFTPTIPASDDEYTIVVDYKATSATSNYANATNTTKFITAKLTSDVTINVENITYGNDTNVTFTITLASGVDNATVVVTKGTSGTEEVYNEDVNLTSGSASITLPVLAAGDYTITVTSIDNAVYRPSSNHTVFNIAQVKPVIEITTTSPIAVFGDVNVTVTVNNNKNGKIKLAADNGATIPVDEITLDENGTAVFTINAIQAGKTTVTATFTPTDTQNYTSGDSESIEINLDKITPEITVVLDSDVCVGQDVILNVTLTNNGTGYGPDGDIVVTENGMTIGTGSLTDGAVQINLGASPVGTYTVMVYYVSTDLNYNDNNVSFTHDVNKWNISYTIEVANCTIKDELVLNVTANVATTSPIPFDKNFTVEIIGADNVTSIKLEPNHKTELTYKLAAGEYTLKISYAGDDNYNGNTTTSEVFAVKDIIENLTVTVENVAYPNQAVAVVNASVDGKYNVTVKGKSYIVTVENGIGNVTLDILAPEADIDVTVESLIDGYNTTTNSTKFTVDYGRIVGTITIADVTYLENVTVIISDANVNGVYNITDDDAGTHVLANVTVADGQGSVNFAINKNVGTYTFYLFAPTNANYTNSEKLVNFTEFKVTNATIEFTVTVDDVNYPDQAIVIVNSNVDGNYSVMISGVMTDKVVKVVNGTGNVTLDLRAPGFYKATVNITKANYDPAKVSDTFTVEKGNAVFNATFENLVYDGSTKVKLTLHSDVLLATNKGYEIFLDGKNVTKLSADGDTFELGVLAAGEYTVVIAPNATDAAFEYYNVENYTTTFTVETGSIGLTVTVDNVRYPNAASVEIKANVTGNYTVKVGTVEKEVAVEANHPENVTIEGLTVGRYTATVTSLNANYTTTTNSTYFAVTYGAIDAKLNIPTVAYGTQPVAIVNESNADGAFTITVNGKDYTVNVVNGTGNVTLDKEVFYVGTYTAAWEADIIGYDPFIGAPITFTVEKATVNLTIEVTTVEYPNQAVATVYANVPGVYNVTIEGTDYSYNVTVGTSGSNTQTIDLLAVNNGYKAIVKVAEINGNYTAPTANAEFNVTVGTPVINIKVGETYEVLDNVSIVITVPYATGKVNITDSLYSAYNKLEQLENGTYTYNITAVKGLGTHVIYVELIDDHNFTSNIANAKFEVTMIATGFEIDDNKPVYEDDAIITLNITGLANGTAPAGDIIIVGYNTTAATNETMTFNLGKLAAGEYNLNITYTGDTAYYAGYSEIYKLVVKKFTPTVNATATGATFPDNATVTFSSNRTGNFTIFVYNEDLDLVQTIEVGIVANDTKKVVNIAGLTAGKYTAYVVYIETENYDDAVNATEFSIKQGTATIDANVTGATYPAKATVDVVATQNGVYIITVIDKDGKVVDTQTGDLVADKVTTVELGLIDAGEYKVNVTYENDNFTAEGVQKDLTINKGVPIIAVVGIGATYPDTGVVEFMSSAAGDYTVTIGTFTTTGTFAAYELVTIDVPQLGAGDFDVVVDYAENANYNATTATGSFVIAKATPDIFIDVDTVLIGENATVIVVIDNATGIVTINGNNVELVDGFATYNIGTLKAETYDITAVYGGDANFTMGNETLSFTVSRLPANLAIAATNTTYGTSPVVTITLDDKSDAIVRLYLNGKEAIVEVKNGSYINKLSTPYGLAAGEYNLTAVYKQTDMYEEDTATTFITIAKAEVHMTINASDVTYPNDAVVTVMSDVDGVYFVYVDPTGPSQNVTLKANVPQEVTFSGLAVGEHEACIEFAGNENYTDPMIEIAVFNVLAAPININIDVANVTYPNDVVAYVSSDVAGKYTIAISGSTTTQTIDVVAGEATKVIFAELDAGDYTITASYGDTENYTGTTKTADVTVAKADVHMTITADNVTYPATVYVTVSSDVAGDYSVYVDPWGIAQNITLAAGESRILAFSGLEAGEHEVCIEYDGSKNYNEDIEFAVFNVLKAPITVTVAADNVTYPADVVVTVTADVAGDYNFTFDDTTQTITLEANVAKVITKSGLTAGTYDITVARAESDNYAAVTETISVNVAKSENTTITVEATSPLAGKNATVTVTLPADATGTVAVKYGNGVYTADVVNGVATVSVPTDVPGTQTATVAYSGDNNYAPASDEVQITVKPNGIIIAGDIKRGVNSPYDYYATFVDADGKAIAGVEITFTIVGQTFKATTDANGIATVSAGLGLVDDKDTKYDVIVTNPYTFENTTATTTIVPRLIVVSGDLTADYLENPPYIVQAIGDDGNPVGAGETVKVVFAGFYYDLLTNETGHVVRTIGLAPGMYAVKACYQGYNTTATVFTVKQVMKVTSGTLKKTAKSYTLKATLKSSDGKALVGKEVSLTFNGKTYNVKTNSKGVASYTIKSSVISKLTAGKTYTLKAKYVNDVRKGKIKVVSK